MAKTYLSSDLKLEGDVKSQGDVEIDGAVRAKWPQNLCMFWAQARSIDRCLLTPLLLRGRLMAV